ncbi:MAG: hypothetical protein H6601_11120 [Flavobacteriales bacterium]|nr:hypothetical protein [Flavobacteriales bacterium]MCB9203874.1 hypothetical protein [Flavobacteriales bacterium]
MKSTNYIIDNDQPIYGISHWDFCWREGQPYVKLRKKGTMYWYLEFDMLPTIRFSRFSKMSFGDYFLPLYKTYAELAKLPYDKYSFVGGGLNAGMTVRKEDAKDLADKMFQLLVQLQKEDERLFNENPKYVNEDGLTPEGYHEESFKKELKEKSPEELYNLFKTLKRGNNYKTTVLSWIKEEIELQLKDGQLRHTEPKLSSDLLYDLFEPEPDTWGLRGDPYLWQEIRLCILDVEGVNDLKEFEDLLDDSFQKITGEKAELNKDIHVPSLEHGGMSSGHVSGSFWLEIGFPLLIKRASALL